MKSPETPALSQEMNSGNQTNRNPQSIQPDSSNIPQWTFDEKVEYFRQIPPVLCPASPPPLDNPLMTEDEARDRSRQRIERMTRRLASLPLYQARHLIQLVSTQLKGPFGPGSKYWGMTPPVATGEPVSEIGPEDTVYSVPCPSVSHFDRHMRDPAYPELCHRPQTQFAIPALPASTSAPHRRSSTGVSSSLSPATPPPAFPVDLDLVPAKTSVGRSFGPVDYDCPSPTRSPTPSIPSSRAASQATSTQRATETPLSQKSFIHELTRASIEASRSQTRRPCRPKSPRPLKKFPSASQYGPRHSTPARRSRSRAPSEQGASGSLVRFSQQIGLTTHVTPRSSQAPMRFSPGMRVSQGESSRIEFYNSELDLEHQIRGIAAFMEGN